MYPRRAVQHGVEQPLEVAHRPVHKTNLAPCILHTQARYILRTCTDQISCQAIANGPRAAGDTQVPIPGLDRSVPFRSSQACPAGLAQQLHQNLMVSVSGAPCLPAASSRPWGSGPRKVFIRPSCPSARPLACLYVYVYAHEARSKCMTRQPARVLSLSLLLSTTRWWQIDCSPCHFLFVCWEHST